MSLAPMSFYAGQGQLLGMIARGAPLPSILEQLARLIEAQAEDLYCSVLLLDEDGLHIRYGVGPRLPDRYLKALGGAAIAPDAGSCGSAMALAQTVIVSDICSDPRWAAYKGLIEADGFRACWSTPILSTQSRVLGSFAMYYKAVRTPAQSELELLAVATQLGGIAIEQQLKQEQLQRYQSQLEALVEQRTAELRHALLEQQALFDNATVGILVVDAERRVLRCNRRLEEMLGYGPGELDGLSTRVYFESDEAWQAYGEATRSALHAGQAYVGDTVAVRKDGRRIWCSSHGKAIDPEDPSKGTIWVGVDITERRLAEAARQELLLEYQAILDNASLGITFTRDRTFLHCNERFDEMFGWPAHALVGQPTLVVYPDEASFEELGRKAIPVLGSGQRLDVELQMRRRDGSLFWCRMLAKAIDPQDRTKGTIFITEDITARKESERALQQALIELQAIFDNTNAGIHLVRERKTIRCNRGMEEMLGYGPGELIGQSTRVIFPSDEDFEALGRSAYETLNRGEVWIGEAQLLAKDGRLIEVSTHSKLMDVHDPSKGTLWVSHDITARKQAEAALLAANEKLERSLAVVGQTYREVSLLGELSSFLQACETPNEAYDCLGRYGPRLFPASSGALYLLNPGSELLEEQMSWGDPQEADPSFGSQACWALRRGRPHLLRGDGHPLCCPHLRLDAQTVASTCLPLVAQGDTFGLLLVLHRGPSLEAEQGDMRQRLAVALAEQMGLALANIRLRETLRLQSIRDPLTGLYNRRFLDEALRRELARARRSQLPLAIALIDVDHFKQFNDRHGHDAGDLVLQEVGRALEACVRASDVVCRFGGEEFVVLMPELPPELALHRAEQLLQGVRQLAPSHGGRPLGPLSASLGLAIFPGHGEQAQGLIDAADAALYTAKREGRDRVMLAAQRLSPHASPPAPARTGGEAGAPGLG
ncbi:diguanylate cyclase [Mitsuaria sp. WAJ17]|uniref:diguanylate cyclase n=1 Tax=Mitsuaria sp. WAJ17 TaxID=2761452 RepID=UPI0016038938|nr:diguanylate cyclase [Mitsuaria sp. WAJ17]MBB2487222.1 diguanylate cyclase [Mitsuaria sp. WAJ17]